MTEPHAAPRGPYRNGVETRRRVVTAAIGTFGRHGYRGGTLQSVADETGITAGAIVRLFGSKENLLLAVVQEWDHQVSQIPGDDPQGLEYFHSLAKIMTLHVHSRGLLELHVRLSAEGGEPRHPAHTYMVDRYRRVRAHIAAELMRAVDEGALAPLGPDEAAHEASCLVAVMDGLQIQWLLDPSMDLERAFGRHLDTLLGRLRQL